MWRTHTHIYILLFNLAFGNTMCHYASKKADCAEIVNCLRNHDGDFEQMNKNGDTPLEMARQVGHPVAFEKGRESNLL